MPAHMQFQHLGMGELKHDMYEYAFARSVQDLNAMMPKDKKISTRSAWHYHDKALEAMPHGPNGDVKWSAVDAKCLEDAMNKAFEDYDSQSVDTYLNHGLPKGYLNSYQSEWMKLVGFQREQTQPGEPSRCSVNARVISPYSREYRDRQGVMDCESELQYLRKDDYDVAESMTKPRRDGNKYDTDILQQAILRREDKVNGGFEEKSTRTLVSQEDMSGLSKLRKFMSRDDYEAVREHASKPCTKEGERAGMYMDQKSQARAAEFLALAEEAGIKFKFTRGIYPGQLEAESKEDGVSMRVMDATAPEFACNSARSDSGLRGRIRDTTLTKVEGEGYVDKKTGQMKDKWVPNMATNESTGQDAMEMYNYMSGRDMAMRPDGKPLGSIGTRPADGFKKGEQNLSYHTTGSSNGAPVMPFVADIGVIPGHNRGAHKEMYIHSIQKGSTEALYKPDVARLKLTDWYDKAKAGLEKSANTEGIIEYAKMYGSNPNMAPDFTEDSKTIMNAQRLMYDYLTGMHGDGPLPVPGTERHDFTGDGDVDDEDALDGEGQIQFYPDTMSKEDQVRAYMSDLIEHEIGHMEKDEDGLLKVDENGHVDKDSMKINPDGLVQHMGTAGSIMARKEDLQTVLRALGATPDNLQGKDSMVQDYANGLRRFDPGTASMMSNHESPFIREMCTEIQNAVQANGGTVNPEDILIDHQGLVQYSGKRQMTKTGKTMSEFTGTLGPLYAPDRNGAVLIKNEIGDDKLAVPGRIITVEKQKAGENKPAYERYRVVDDYETAIKRGIHTNVADGMMRKQASFGGTNNMARCYRHLYDEQLDGDFYEKSLARGVDPAHTDVVVRHMASRITPTAEMQEAFSQSAIYMKGDSDLKDLHADVQYEPDGIALAMTMEFGAKQNIVDPYVTSTGGNLGWHMYMAEGTTIDKKGYLHGTKEQYPMSPLSKEMERMGRYNPEGAVDSADRHAMSVMAAAQNYTTNRPMNITMTNIGGTMEDSIYITSDMAKECMLPDHANKGEFRPAMTGDKMQMHGNKGVVVVVDMDMTRDEAKEKGQEKVWELFKDNNKDGRKLDMVFSPFSGVSRFNAGIYQEAQNLGGMQELHVNGEVRPNAIFKNYVDVMPKQAVDKKTVDYTQDAGKSGRAYGAQLNMALTALGCYKTIEHSFRDNKAPYLKAREALITCGMDMGPDGTMYLGYHPHPGEERHRFGVPEPKYNKNGFDERAVRLDFEKTIADKGGIMELPFKLNYLTPKDKKGEPLGVTQSLDEIDASTRSSESKDAYGGQTYAMHVAPASFRNDKDMSDGTVSYSNYTRSLESIYTAAAEYIAADRAGNENKKKEAQAAAQMSFDRMQEEVSDRYFEGKHNIFRSGLMSAKQPNSVTAVWTGDPNLDVDKIDMGADIAKGLGVKEGDWVTIHRDPALQDSAIWFTQVGKIREDLTGISINPMGIPGQMDGDFDGDSVGIVKFDNPEVVAELKKYASVQNRLVDYSKVDKETGEMELVVADGQDVTAGWAADPSLKDRYKELRSEANHTLKAYEAGAIDYDTFADKNKATTDAVSDYLRAVTDAGFGRYTIQFGDKEEHLRSMEPYVHEGAKGSPGKVDEYAMYLGAKVERDADKQIVSVEDTGKSAITPEQMQGIPYAKRTQVEKTGVAGQKNIETMAVVWGDCPKEALRLQKLVTQGVLQVKHDSQQAENFQRIMGGPMENMWAGNKMQMYERTWQDYMKDEMAKSPRGCFMHDEESGSLREMKAEDYKNEFVKKYGKDSYYDWKVVTGPDGKPEKATKADFMKTFAQIYGKEGLGFSYNQEHLDKLADTLVDKNTGTMRGLKDQARKEEAVPMVKVAYATKGQGFASVYELAQAGSAGDTERANLFTGRSESGKAVKTFECMAPREVRMNIEIARENKEREAQGLEPKSMVAIVNRGAVSDDTYGKLRDETVKASEQILKQANPGEFKKNKAERAAGADDFSQQEALFKSLYENYVMSNPSAGEAALAAARDEFKEANGRDMDASDLKAMNQQTIEGLRKNAGVSLDNLYNKVPAAMSVIENDKGESITERWAAKLKTDAKATIYDVLDEKELSRAREEVKNYDGKVIAPAGVDSHMSVMSAVDTIKESDIQDAMDVVNKSGGAKMRAIESLETGYGKISVQDKREAGQVMDKLMTGAKSQIQEAADAGKNSILGYDNIRVHNVANAFEASTSVYEMKREEQPNETISYQKTGKVLGHEEYAKQMQDIAKDFGVHLTDHESQVLAGAALEANRQFMERRNASRSQQSGQPSSQAAASEMPSHGGKKSGFDATKQAQAPDSGQESVVKGQEQSARPESAVGMAVLKKAEEEREQQSGLTAPRS